MTQEKLEKKIIDTIKAFGGKRFRRRELFGFINFKGLDYNEFKRVLSHLERSGTIIRTKGRKFALSGQSGILTGIFTASRNGGGHVRLPDGGTVYVRQGYAGEALPGDTVQFKMLKKGRVGFSRAAEIIRIIERSTKPVIGIFNKYGGTAYIIPQGDGFSKNLLVKNNGGLDAEDGNLVVCRVEMPSKGYSRPMCIVTEVLGDPDSPGVDVLAIAKRYDLPIIFPEEVLRESENIQSDPGIEILKNRRDIRDIITFTIDPVDAKDFDDAISISRVDNGNFELGVHIADVSHYVKDGTAIDIEAQLRGMSCYLVDRVIPMLPERLSNNLCSLKASEDRVTKSVFVVLDRKGNIIKHEITNTVINSNVRLTYEQVQAYLDSSKKDGAGKITPEVGEALEILSELTDILIERRNERGALDFELPEALIVLDEVNKPVDIIKRERFKAHKMIEEAMLLANTIIADVLAKAKAPFLYRVHDKPEEEKMVKFSETAHLFGYVFRSTRAQTPKYIQSFLMSLHGKLHEKQFNMILLRSMKKACYSTRNTGHFGLALQKYAHFTSPIRRYPDLIAHRQLDTYVLGNSDKRKEHEISYYDTLGSHVTEREIIIDSADRDSIKMKKAEFMKMQLGEEFEGTVSGIIPKGIFVELDKYFVEGLIHVSSLNDDYYEIDSTGIAMIGRNKGKRYMIGDRLKVVVASADKVRGEVDFVLIKKILRNKK